MRPIIITLLALAACTQAPPVLPPPSSTPLVLTGAITRADHQTYREIPFTVPPGTQRIVIDFTYDKENRTVIDLGLRDPQGQRGWSGGNKSHIEVGVHDATPSYRPGPIQPGEWTLVLGVPNIREKQTASYTATIRFEHQVSSSGQPPAASGKTDLQLTPSPGWYRGDLHTHTAHSDGSCEHDGARQPCPTRHTAAAARAAGLDFVAITDHNTITQLPDISELQSAHPNTLLIPGTEITTFNGHANVIGNTSFLDFQLGSPRLPTLAKLFDQVDAANAFVSVNHPSLPSGEACMGCGWTVKDTDWSRVTAIEVINGASMRTSGPEGAFNGIAFWETLLREGHRITAIAGSDNHDATDTTGAKQSPVGIPATVVYADQLSTPGIIAGIRSGRVFIDVADLQGAWLDANASSALKTALMGGEIALAESRSALLSVRWAGLPPDAQLKLVSHNVVVGADKDVRPPPRRADERFEVLSVELTPGAEQGYVRPEIRDAAGRLLLLGNPIYFRRAG